ncbi:MAG: hypothetical protein Q9M92_11505 [Enterobacterales bacterium]|nr:hypothetical protein [Enterobacterales bacterium]
MKAQKHQWSTFQKGRIKIKACSTCGELHLPSNSEQSCLNNRVLESPIFQAGYRLHSDQPVGNWQLAK